MTARAGGMHTLEMDLRGIFNGPTVPKAERLDDQEVLLLALATEIAANCKDLKWHRRDRPLLYQSGLRYLHDETRELYADIPSALRRGSGDCKVLSGWRIAELRKIYGVEADPHIIWTQLDDEMVAIATAQGKVGYKPGDYLFHCVVRRPRPPVINGRAQIDNSWPPYSTVPAVSPSGRLTTQPVLMPCYGIDENGNSFEDVNAVVEDPSAMMGMNWQELYAKSNRRPDSRAFADYIQQITGAPGVSMSQIATAQAA